MSRRPSPAITSEPDLSHVETSRAATRRAVSVSLGSSKRDIDTTIELLGESVRIERRGTDGDFHRATRLVRELDGEVDAIGLGGLDLYVTAAGRNYYLRDGLRLAREAKTTPVVCGAGLKDSLERVAIAQLDELVGWRGRRVLMVSAVDRFGMAEALVQHEADVRFGDLIFALGLPLPIRNLRQLELLARTFLPLVSKLPISWIYPTGKRQEGVEKGYRGRFFEWAQVIAGDFHFIRRYAPGRLDDKIVLTNTTTAQDMSDLRARGSRALITTTPRLDGRSIATNLLDAALIAATGRHPLSAHEYRDLIARAGLTPTVEPLQEDAFPQSDPAAGRAAAEATTRAVSGAAGGSGDGTASRAVGGTTARDGS